MRVSQRVPHPQGDLAERARASLASLPRLGRAAVISHELFSAADAY